MRRKWFPWSKIGGFGPWVVSLSRVVGLSSRDIWRIGRGSRRTFLFLASCWQLVPLAVRKRSPLQIIEMMSVRFYQGRFPREGFSGLSGVFARSDFFMSSWGETVCLENKKLHQSFVGVLPHPDESFLRQEVLLALDGVTAVSGGSDATFPGQWDRRHADRAPAQVKALIESIAQSGCTRWYAENLTSRDKIFSPIPGGVSPSPWRGSVSFVRTRPKRVFSETLALCAHREGAGRRAGPQFDERRKVSNLARKEWADFVQIPGRSVSLQEFRVLLRRNSFTLCVEGGGIDPSPKAFEALRQGSIPVIKESPTADAYRHFPVLVVEEWEEDRLSRDFLESESKAIRAAWPDWCEVVERMKLSYWLDFISRAEDTRVHRRSP